MPKYDLCIIGGGPAGLMAGLSAGLKGKKVILVERKKELGFKILLTGGGRCNLTQMGLTKKEFVLNFGKQGDFLLSALSKFGPKETFDFFTKKGLPLKIENNGRVYPESEKAKDVLGFFKKELKRNKVKVLLNAEVLNLIFKDGKIEKIVLKDKEIFANNFLLAVGGKSYFSNQNGYDFAKRAGHTIEKLRPALAPIETKEKWVRALKGLSLEKVGVSLNDRKPLIGDVLFTHFGLSGPSILNLSEDVESKDKIYIDLFPLKTVFELEGFLLDLFNQNLKKTVLNTLSDFVPLRLLSVLLNYSGIEKTDICRNVSKEKRKKLVKVLKNIEFNVLSVLGFEKAMVTKGGVSLKEIDSKKMRSKFIENLYFAGEIMDLNGKTGGFNLQMCFTTGFVAGESIL